MTMTHDANRQKTGPRTRALTRAQSRDRRALGLLLAAGVMLILLAVARPATADRRPVRDAEEETTGRRGIDSDRISRRPIEGGDDAEAQAKADAERKRLEEERKAKTAVINLHTPSRCGATKSPKFRNHLLGLTNPDSADFYVELWGNKRVYYEFDEVLYFLRSNKEAYVTMFWIGPEGSVFIPFINQKIEANRDHLLDPNNIIVQPVGRERWRVIATPSPHELPCRVSDADWVRAIERIQGGVWASGRWDVLSKVGKRRRLRGLHR